MPRLQRRGEEEREEREGEGLTREEEREREGCSCRRRRRGLLGAQWVWSVQFEESIAASLAVNGGNSRSAEGGVAVDREYLIRTFDV